MSAGQMLCLVFSVVDVFCEELVDVYDDQYYVCVHGGRSGWSGGGWRLKKYVQGEVLDALLSESL